MHRPVITALIIGAILVLFVSYIVGDRLNNPVLRSVGRLPPDFPTQIITIPTGSDESSVGWFAYRELGSVGVLLVQR